MKTRKEIEDRITLFMTNIRKGLSYDANVVLLTNDIEEAIKQGQEWEGEEGALSFIFGEIKPSKALIKALKADLSKLPELKEGECNMDCY